MIVRETEDQFVMVGQHDHARLSGDAASHFTENCFVDTNYVQDVLTGVYEHDRSWIRLDDTPVWNDRDHAPFSFMDYPLLPKLTLYKQGIDEVELRNPYAALLCSLHYASFSIFQTSELPECKQFYQHELERQARIKSERNSLDEQALRSHFQLLQLCDDISLYVCLNRPGAGKEEEHPWYRKGFKNSELITGNPEHRIIPHWVSDKAIRITPSPFTGPFDAKLKLKRVSKRLAAEIGIGDAYKQTEWSEQTIVFLS